MARKATQAIASLIPTHESIAADIAAFRKRGGRIEVLGNTPLRKDAPTPFHSSPAKRKPPTPLPKKRASR